MAVSVFGKNVKYIVRNDSSASLLNKFIRIGLTPVRQVSSSAEDSGDKNKPARSKLSWREEKISNAMKSYITFREKNDAFMEEEIAKYEIGKRHLANIMGEDPNEMSQMKVKIAIEYLFPSGLSDKKARPQLKHPDNSLPKAKVAQFDLDGRPFNPFYYTGLPNFYTIMHQAAQQLIRLKIIQSKELNRNRFGIREERVNLAGSWVKKIALESQVNEKLTDDHYARFIVLMDKLLYHPYSAKAEPFLKKYRHFYEEDKKAQGDEVIDIDKLGRAYRMGEGTRKTAKATVKITQLSPEEHTATVTINGKSFLHFFPELREREIIAHPFIFTGLLGKFHIEAKVSSEADGNDGRMCHAGAIRLAICRALCSFVDSDVVEQLRLAGMLTADPRRRERKKPGQKKARKKFTWKAR